MVKSSRLKVSEKSRIGIEKFGIELELINLMWN